ncbi:hypothetical protein D7X30_00870 [Corallococcus sp. AB011P]|uniref:hypothetical protein n=1 Tax=unclassified Corallococcus TaxID=2685029 RepID=UPI000EA2FB74|nr:MULTISPECIES: hypothetical protein [unclassified Corallococcus]RKG61929.1 hypothetical protein D7X30_00870 [Corallococcus sp. AB011P]RKH79527.1 hypothetical protein D7Y21_33690 [Corallococcus sp. AB045]
MSQAPETEAHADHAITRRMGDREQVEQTADRIRDELLLTLEELDRRRTRATDVRYHVNQNKDLLMTVGAAALVAVGLGVGFAIYRARHHDERVRRQRRRALERAWAHPDRVATSIEDKPLGAELGRKVVMIFATSLATAVARNSIQTLVPSRAITKVPADKDKKS